MAFQITGVTIIHSTVCSGTDQRKHECSTSLAFVNSPVTGEFPAQRASNAKMFPFDGGILRFFWVCLAWKGILATSQGLYSLSGKTSYHQISWSLEAAIFVCCNDGIALKFDRHLGSSNAGVPIKFQSGSKSLNPNLAATRLNEILRQDICALNEERPSGISVSKMIEKCISMRRQSQNIKDLYLKSQQMGCNASRHTHCIVDKVR